MEYFGQHIAQRLSAALNQTLTLSALETPPEEHLGDFAYPCFQLAKLQKQSPQSLALQIYQTLKNDPLLDPHITLQTQGAYVNFIVAPHAATQHILNAILTSHYGQLPACSRQTWIFEYSSPNIAKPLNIYHLRTTLLGAALDRIARYRGYHAISINHLGDWGKQYGLLAIGLKNHDPSQLTMEQLVQIYVQIHADIEKNPELEQEAKKAFLKLEQGDPAMTTLWKTCVEISLRSFKEHYQQLGVHFDYYWGESFYQDQLQPLLQSLKTQGLLIPSEGAWIVPTQDPKGHPLPPCLLQKQDGATLYATRDLAAALFRYQRFQFDRMTYIVGGEQKLHFQQLFSVLTSMQLPWAPHCEHIPTGLYRFHDSKMSTRKGNFVTFQEVFEHTKEKVLEIMAQRSQLNPEDSASIALGAILFQDLHTDPARDVDFNIKNIIDFEGETGPYLQYAHTRCLGILKKSTSTPLFSTHSLLQHPLEIQLIKTLGQFPMVLERSLELRKANQLAHYLIQVTKRFHSFYHECHVLNQEPSLTQARLLLVQATQKILHTGLSLLGIPTPQRM